MPIVQFTEERKMDAEQINKRIHEFVTGTNCDHNEISKADGSEPWQCQQCGRTFLDDDNWFPKPYTTDLNAVREAELKCIEEFGEFEYGTALLEYLDEGGLHYNPNLDNKHAARLALLPAEIRAQAVYDVLEKL